MPKTALSKQQLGQFFTVNSDYVLQGLEKFVVGKNVIDPFAGSGDLLEWAIRFGAKKVKGFDIDHRLVGDKKIVFGDSLKEDRKYDFVLTNPPYLNVNKADRKTKELYFRNSSLEDLYQISLNSIMDSKEGIVIVPINFLSAENSAKIRSIFFSKFKIVRMNYFRHQVFPDTTYNVVAFYYKANGKEAEFSIPTHIYPDKKVVRIKLKKQFEWTIGGEILGDIKKQKNVLGVHRLSEKDIISGNKRIKAAHNHVKTIKEVRVAEPLYKLIKSNIILLKAIDSGSDKGKIALEDIRKYGLDCLISKETSRHMIYLTFRKPISLKEQEKIISIFNSKINELRDDHLSLFMTNYRDKDRKRISFDLVYKLINQLYFSDISKDKNQIKQLALV